MRPPSSASGFIRETSHELRTPIMICRGHLELLGPEPERAELEQTVDLVIDELDEWPASSTT